MKKSRFSAEQIVGVLKEAEAGVPVAEICGRLGVSEAKRLQEELRRRVKTQAALLSEAAVLPAAAGSSGCSSAGTSGCGASRAIATCVGKPPRLRERIRWLPRRKCAIHF